MVRFFFFFLPNLISLLFPSHPRTSDQVRALETAALVSKFSSGICTLRSVMVIFCKGQSIDLWTESLCIESASWLCSGLICVTVCSYLNDNESPPSFRLTLIATRYAAKYSKQQLSRSTQQRRRSRMWGGRRINFFLFLSPASLIS